MLKFHIEMHNLVVVQTATAVGKIPTFIACSHTQIS